MNPDQPKELNVDTIEFYAVPCCDCGQGIARTGKRGRPPKRHPNGNCPTTTKVATIIEDGNEPIVLATDDEAKAVDEFLKAAPQPTRSPLAGMRDDRMPRKVSKLVKGDTVLYQRSWVKLKAAPKPDGNHHVILKFDDGGTIRVYKDGNAFIPV